MIVTMLAIAAVLAPAARAPLDAAVEEAVADGFAGEVLVTNERRVAYARVVSVPGRPHRRRELWRWASVTKQITATMAMQAVAARRLSLDDTVAARLPEFRGASAKAITIRMLLQHTSGLPNPDDSAGAGAGEMPAFYRRSIKGVGGAMDALGYCAGQPKGEPGAAFAYNNCDFIVLGAILERLSGSPYSVMVQDAIARPAGLPTLHILTDAHASPRLVKGVREDGSPEPAFNLATFGAAGAAYGSADDLAGFDRALLNGKLLDEAGRAAAWSGDPKLGYVALGVWSFPASLRGCAQPVPLVERRGEIGGVEVRNLIAPRQKLALVIFADKAGLAFGEIWQGKGLSYDLASAAFCGAPS